MTQQPSGWYDDPDDPTYLRYFDGVVWTDHREPKVLPRRESSDPYAAGADPYGAQRTGSQDPYAGGGQGSSPSGWAGGRHSGPWGGQGQYGQQPGQQQGGQPWGPPQYGQYGGQPGQPPYGGQPGQPGAPWQQPYPAGPWAAVPTLHGRRLAGWWMRVLAYLLDGFTVGLLIQLLVLPLSSPYIEALRTYFDEVVNGNQSAVAPAPDARMLAAGLVAGVLWVLYDAVCTSRWGRTLGKRIAGLRVVDVERPERLSFGRALVRAVVKHAETLVNGVPALSTIASFFMVIDYLWPLWDKPNKQALHDKLAQSAVVRDV